MNEPADEARVAFARITYDMRSHITNARITAHLEAAQLYRRGALTQAERDLTICMIAKDMTHPDADIRKGAKDALHHAFNANRIYGMLASTMSQTDLYEVIVFAMEGLRGQAEETRLASRFFIGKIIDECTLERLRELEMALLAGHREVLGKYGTEKSIEWWKPEIEMRRRETYCGVSGEDSGIRRAGTKRKGEERSHLRIIRTG